MKPLHELGVAELGDIASLGRLGWRTLIYTAVVTGIYLTKGTYSGRIYEHTGRFTDTWIFENGRWLCVASHTSLVKK